METKSENAKDIKILPDVSDRDHDNVAARLIMPQNPDPYFAASARYAVKNGNTRFASLRGGIVPLSHATRVMQQLQQAGIISKEPPHLVLVRDCEALEKALARL